MCGRESPAQAPPRYLLCDDRVRDLAELETAEHTSRFQYTVRFSEDSVDMSAVADSKGDSVQIDRVVGYRVEVFSVAERE